MLLNTERAREILDREQQTLEQAHGYESSRMNDFQQRRHAEVSELSDSIEQFRDYRFEDGQAGEDFRELLEELEDATPAEYNELVEELTSIGYNLHITNQT